MRSFALITAAALLAAAPAAAETAFDGPYVGAVGGLQLHSANRAITTGTAGFQALGPAVAPAVLDLDDNNGWQGGIVAGWNFSSGNIVFGVEGDFVMGNIKGEAVFSGAGVAGVAPLGLTTRAYRRIGNRGSARARAGIMIGEKAMVYATGGAALGDTRASANVIVNGGRGQAWAGEAEDTRFGWTVGGGAEFKLSDSLGLRAEYIYTNLGRQYVLATGNALVRATAALNGVDYEVGTPNRSGVVRVGATFKF